MQSQGAKTCAGAMNCKAQVFAALLQDYLQRYHSNAALTCRLAVSISSVGGGTAMKKMSALGRTATGVSSWKVSCSYPMLA